MPKHVLLIYCNSNGLGTQIIALNRINDFILSPEHSFSCGLVLLLAEHRRMR